LHSPCNIYACLSTFQRPGSFSRGNILKEIKSWEPQGPVQQVYDLDVITHAAENNSQNFKVQSKGSRLSIF
jgi:hypothetical protein